MKKQHRCKNCHMYIDVEAKVCPFCGEEVKESVKKDTSEAVEQKPSKRKLLKHELFYLIGAGLGVLALILFLLPASGDYAGSIFRFAFALPSDIKVGANAATICFVFSVVGLLDYLAIYLSLKRKTTEVGLFSYFTAFFYVVVAVTSFLSPLLFSNGKDVSTFTTLGVGFIIVGVLSLASAVMSILAVIKYKKYIIDSPIETYKAEPTEE